MRDGAIFSHAARWGTLLVRLSRVVAPVAKVVTSCCTCAPLASTASTSKPPWSRALTAPVWPPQAASCKGDAPLTSAEGCAPDSIQGWKRSFGCSENRKCSEAPTTSSLSVRRCSNMCEAACVHDTSHFLLVFPSCRLPFPLFLVHFPLSFHFFGYLSSPLISFSSPFISLHAPFVALRLLFISLHFASIAFCFPFYLLSLVPFHFLHHHLHFSSVPICFLREMHRASDMKRTWEVRGKTRNVLKVGGSCSFSDGPLSSCVDLRMPGNLTSAWLEALGIVF